jgi:hypothetical protein
MKKYFILLSFCLFTAQILLAQMQNMEVYNQHVRAADSLCKIQDFQGAAQEYGKAFRTNGGVGKTMDKYNAACSWSRADNADSAFKLLYQVVTREKYDNYHWISTDPDLVNLHSDSRWQPLLDSVLKNLKEAEPNLNLPLQNELDSIYNDDQHPRLVYIDLLKKSGGKITPQVDSIINVLHFLDSVNDVKVEKILDTYGWLGADVVGQHGNNTLWVVIQHANLAMQKKYQPMMEDAWKKGNLRPSQYALTIDRILMNEGKKQIYGSQLKSEPSNLDKYYVYPMVDPDNVDKRRAEMQLDPMEDYVKQFGVQWNLEEYKKNLPKYEEWSKIVDK